MLGFSRNIIGKLNFKDCYMLSLFKRTKVEFWEIELMVNVLKKLPDEFHLCITHINEGLFRGVLIGLSDIPGYIGFTYNPEIYEKFQQPDGKNFRLEGITVFDIISNEYLYYTIYFSYGVINGYSITGAKKIKIDIQKIDVSNFKLKYRENIDFDRLKNFLTSEELKLINPNDVYVVSLEDKEYFHLMDIEDGDFYGMDLNKNLYKITHDPYNIEKMDISLSDLMEVN